MKVCSACHNECPDDDWFCNRCGNRLRQILDASCQHIENLRGWDKSSSLSGIDVSGCDLSHLDLSDANLTGAIFEGATLFYTNLSGATLRGARLQGADL